MLVRAAQAARLQRAQESHQEGTKQTAEHVEQSGMFLRAPLPVDRRADELIASEPVPAKLLASICAAGAVDYFTGSVFLLEQLVDYSRHDRKATNLHSRLFTPSQDYDGKETADWIGLAQVVLTFWPFKCTATITTKTSSPKRDRSADNARWRGVFVANTETSRVSLWRSSGNEGGPYF